MNFISLLLASPLEKVGNKIADALGALLAIIPKYFFLFFSLLMQIVDIMQLFFKKLAGLDVYYVDGVATEGDVTEALIREVLLEKGALNNPFWGIMVIGIILLFVSTIIAVMRTQYMAEDSKSASVKKPINAAIRAIVSFIAVPAFCLFGIYLANQILIALDQATNGVPNDMNTAEMNYYEPYTTDDGEKTYYSLEFFGINIGTKTQSFSGTVFSAAAYNSNRVRIAGNSIEYEDSQDYLNNFMEANENSPTTNFGVFVIQGNDYESCALKIDQAFSNGYRLKHKNYLDVSAKGISRYFIVEKLDPFFSQTSAEITAFSKFRPGVVWYFYDLWRFDFILGFTAFITIFLFYINIILALVKRMIELVILLIVSPGVIGVMPLDNGESMKKWRTQFIGKTIMAYGTVIGMNLVFLILPVFDTITIFPNTFGLNVMNAIIKILVTIAALATIGDITKVVGDVVGAEDANAIGGKMQKDVMNTAMKTANLGATLGSATLQTLGAGAKAVGAVASPVIKGAGKLAGNAINGINKAIEPIKGKVGAAVDKARKNAFRKHYTNSAGDKRGWNMAYGKKERARTAKVEARKANRIKRTKAIKKALDTSLAAGNKALNVGKKVASGAASFVSGAVGMTFGNLYRILGDGQVWGNEEIQKYENRGIGLKSIGGILAGKSIKEITLDRKEFDAGRKQGVRGKVYEQNLNRIISEGEAFYRSKGLDKIPYNKWTEAQKRELGDELGYKFSIYTGSSATDADKAQLVQDMITKHPPVSGI